MIIARSPMRVSLAGGSTDLQDFIDVYNHGAVINFAIDLHTYIIITRNVQSKYKIIYSHTEEVDHIDDIQNDIAREVLRYFDPGYVQVIFHSDIPSSKSGLASSSSYILSMIKATSHYIDHPLNNADLCELGLEIEKKFNPLSGYQDIYGCVLPGLKRMDFYKSKASVLTSLDASILDNAGMYLYDTTVRTKSTSILKTLNLESRKPLMELVDNMEKIIIKNQHHALYQNIQQGWEEKKKTSKRILDDNAKLIDIEQSLKSNSDVYCYRLCGSGAGGYFLVLGNKEQLQSHSQLIPINIDETGVKVWVV